VSRKIGIDYRHWAYHCLSKKTRLFFLKRRKHKIEGSFADAANNHGFKKARYRGLEKVTLQNLLVATIQNIRKLIKVNALKPAVSMAKSALHKTTYATLSRLSYCRMALIANLSRYLVFKELFQLFQFKLFIFIKSFSKLALGNMPQTLRNTVCSSSSLRPQHHTHFCTRESKNLLLSAGFGSSTRRFSR
jgi:hypothetical protein